MVWTIYVVAYAVTPVIGLVAIAEWWRKDPARAAHRVGGEPWSLALVFLYLFVLLLWTLLAMFNIYAFAGTPFWILVPLGWLFGVAFLVLLIAHRIR